MKFGYMPHFDKDLRSEVEFARKHFDFVEITLRLNLDQYNDEYLEDLKDKLKGYNALGHLHWDIDLTKNNERILQLIYDFIDIFKGLDINKLTIHPSTNDVMNRDEMIEVNLEVLSKISEYCKKIDIDLLLENSTHYPFNRADVLESMIDQIDNLSLTLDTGHALLVSKEELEKFLQMDQIIEHIHLHNCIDGNDHIFFKNQKNLNQMLDQIKKSGYGKTVTLEMFEILEGDNSISIEAHERRNKLLEQLRMIKG